MPNRPTGSEAASRYCPSCGARSQRQWKFCAGCGERLPLLEDVRQRVAPRAKPRQQDLVAALIEEPPRTPTQPEGDHGAERPGAGESPPPEPEMAAPPPALDTAAAARVDEVVDRSPAAVPLHEPSVVADGSDHGTDVPPDLAVHGSSIVTDDVPLEPLPELAEASVSAGFAAGPRQGRDTGYLQIAALVSATLAVVVAGGLIVLNRRLADFGSGSDIGAIDSADRWVDQVFQPLFFVSVIVLLAGMAQWTIRRRRELEELDVGASRFADGTAAASWLIPGVNLVLPVMVLDELWRGGRAIAGDELDEQPNNPWLWVWAVVAAIGVVIAVVAAAMSPSSIEGTIDANTWSGIGYALIGLALMVLVVTMSAVATTLRMSIRRTGRAPVVTAD